MAPRWKAIPAPRAATAVPPVIQAAGPQSGACTGVGRGPLDRCCGAGRQGKRGHGRWADWRRVGRHGYRWRRRLCRLRRLPGRFEVERQLVALAAHDADDLAALGEAGGADRQLGVARGELDRRRQRERSDGAAVDDDLGAGGGAADGDLADLRTGPWSGRPSASSGTASPTGRSATPARWRGDRRPRRGSRPPAPPARAAPPSGACGRCRTPSGSKEARSPASPRGGGRSPSRSGSRLQRRPPARARTPTRSGPRPRPPPTRATTCARR